MEESEKEALETWNFSFNSLARSIKAHRYSQRKFITMYKPLEFSRNCSVNTFIEVRIMFEEADDGISLNGE